LGGLSIWVVGRQFPDARDFWDGNWLVLRARMEAPGATVQCEGPFLMASDVERFRNELAAASETLAGEATLGSVEPNLTVKLEVRRLGQVTGEVEITPEHLSQFHRFTLELDQSYLPAMVDSCDALLDRFPVLGTP
ncbi:MAG TPA: hypothetical protein VGB54_09530, partial [Allosphingosinicella sp.]